MIYFYTNKSASWERGQFKNTKQIREIKVLDNNNPNAKATTKRTILIVDDEPINRKLLGLITGGVYNIVYAEDGKEALEKIKEQANRFSIVLLDLVMPEMSGYEVLTYLQKDENLKKLPVIVLTSEKDAEVKSIKLGAVDFMPKPFEKPEVILTRIQRSIELAEDKILVSENERDPLTNVYNKSFFFHYAKQHDRFYYNLQKDAIVITVNRLKLIREMYGENYARLVIVSISNWVANFMPEGEYLLGRDNDSFLIYGEHIFDYDMMLKSFNQYFEKNINTSKVRVSFGIYPNVDINVPIEDRFNRAHLVAEKLNSSYKNEYGLYDESAHKKVLLNEKLVQEFESALEQKQFTVYFQPKFNIEDQEPRLVSAEALVRWIHPELGFISPGDFIPLFEENGLISDLDRYVWNEVAKAISQWKKDFGKSVPISINVSRIDLFDPKLPEILTKICDDNGLTTVDILLEITESAYTADSDQITEVVEHLRSLGFRIEMDDFGTGYSSLGMLASLTIDALKLDMSFVREITTNPKSLKMLQFVIDIGKFLNVPIVAEGVETQEQCKLLKDAGCTIVQGYLYSKPLPEAQFVDQFIK